MTQHVADTWELNSPSVTRERRLRQWRLRVAALGWTKLLPFLASQQLVFALLYDLIRNNRPPSAALTLTIGGVALGSAFIARTTTYPRAPEPASCNRDRSP